MRASRRGAVLLGCLAAAASAAPVFFDNLAPRLDVNGAIIDAHDGPYQRFSPGGLYYYFAVAYGSCVEPTRYGCDQTVDKCGFQVGELTFVGCMCPYRLSSAARSLPTASIRCGFHQAH
jgi:hypothetical protein